MSAGGAIADTIADEEVVTETAARGACYDEELAGLLVLELTLTATAAAGHRYADAESLVRGHFALGGVLKNRVTALSIF